MSYKNFFDMSLDLLCIAGTDGYFKEVNPAFCKALGYTREEMLAAPFVDFIHPEDLAKTAKEVEKLKGGEVTIKFENRYRKKAGGYLVLAWKCGVDERGEELYASARDVTAVRAIENRYLKIYSTLEKHTILAVTDRAGNIILANDAFCEISGYAREELLGQNHRIINSGRHSKEFFKNMWQTIAAGNTWADVIENRRKDGSHYYVYSIICPLESGDKSVNYLSIRFDVTKQIEAQKNFQKTMAILNETSSIAKVGGWEMDVATGELTWTDETFKILEVEKKNGQKPMLAEGLQLFTDECVPIITKAVGDAVEKGIPYALELEAKTAKGNVLWVYTNGKANYKDGKVVTLSGTIQDIHARKIAELKYEQQRMRNVQNSKLASLGEMSAGIAHEINNPLAIIKASADLLRKFRDNPLKQERKIEAITKSCERISKIIASLQKFSRSSEATERQPKVLKSIIQEAIGLTKFRSDKQGTKITFNMESEALIYCNEVEIEQIFVNLINNAMDAIKDQPERWIQISGTEDQGKLTVRVMDSGSGIDPKIANRLFEPFFTTKSVGKGTGLGLSITKGIVDEHNGNLSIDVTSDHTCFVIEFPRCEANYDAA